MHLRTNTHTHTHTHICIRVHARKHTNIHIHTCLCKLMESTIRFTHTNNHIYAKNTNEKIDTHAHTRTNTLTSF